MVHVDDDVQQPLNGDRWNSAMDRWTGLIVQVHFLCLRKVFYWMLRIVLLSCGEAM